VLINIFYALFPVVEKMFHVKDENRIEIYVFAVINALVIPYCIYKFMKTPSSSEIPKQKKKRSDGAAVDATWR